MRSRINTDQNPAYGEAACELEKAGTLPPDVQRRRAKHLSNVIEAGHGKLKRLIGPTLGFQSTRTAHVTLRGFEVTRMFGKGQFDFWIECVGGGTGASLVNRLFGTYAAAAA